MNLYIRSLFFCILLSITTASLTQDFSCKGCCNGSQIRVPEMTNLATFTNPNCPDQIDAATLLSLVGGVLENGNILRLLQQELYNRTNPIVMRSLLDLPSLRPYYLDYCGWQFVVQPFYNYMDPVLVTKKSPFLDSYINLENSALANEIDLVLEDINNSGLVNPPINVLVPQSLSLFQPARIQERRVGAMFSFAKEYKDWNFSVRLPAYYLEHNFFLNDAEIDAIKFAPLFALDGLLGNAGTPESVEEFIHTNLVNDKVGLGDTRFMALYNAVNTHKNNIWVGGISTIPTGVQFTEGLLGGKFNKCEPIPMFDLLSVYNLHVCNRDYKITQMLETIGVAAIRKLSILLVDVPMGNGGHLGVGPHVDFKHFFNEYVSCRIMLEGEFFSSKRKKRFFLEDKTQFNFNRDLDDPDQANANLAFLNEQLLNTLFPVCMEVRVHPGALLKARYEWFLDYNCWNLLTGFDFWYTGAEKFSADFCGSKITQATLARGARDSAYQGKVFGSLGYHRRGHHVDWQVALAYDETVFSRGIGKDYTLSLAFNFYL